LFCPFDDEAFTALAVAAALLTNKRNKRTEVKLNHMNDRGLFCSSEK